MMHPARANAVKLTAASMPCHCRLSIATMDRAAAVPFNHNQPKTKE